MWNDFFPNAIIYGVDNFNGPFLKTKEQNPEFTDQQCAEKVNEIIQSLADQGIKVIISDQMDKNTLEAHFDGILFDIVIDDGGHASWQHQKSFEFLWDHVKPGGFYIIEDLATCHMREFREFDDWKSSTLGWIETFNTDNVFSYYIDQEKINRIKSEVFSIQIIGELGIITKKNE